MAGTAADLGTQGGRVRHIRYGLAQQHGNVSLQRLGELVADEETQLTGKPVAAYHASTVKGWEEGARLYLTTALAIASLGGVSAEWLAFGAEQKIQRRPTDDQERRTRVITPTQSDKPRGSHRKSS